MSLSLFLSSFFKDFKKRALPPMVPWCLFFCAGIFLEQFLKAPPGFLLTVLFSGLLLGVCFLRSPVVSSACVFSVALFFGALSLAATDALSPIDIFHATRPERQKVVVRGTVVSKPVALKCATSFIVAASDVSDGIISCRVRGHMFARLSQRSSCAQGDAVVLQGSLLRPYGPWTPFLKSKGVRAVLSVKGREAIGGAGGPGRGSGQLLFFLRGKIEKTMETWLSPLSAGVLEAMILGERQGVPRDLRRAMVKTGTWHLMVVSGYHTGLLAFILLIFLKMLRFPRRSRLVLTMFLLVLYCLLTGASSPVARATVMGIVFLSGFLIERPALIYNSLSLAALAILSFSPRQLFNAGFQLSFLSVIFIVGLYPRIDPPGLVRKIFGPGTLCFRFTAAVAGCLGVSVAAWVGTAPLIAYLFGNFSPWAPLANLIAVPLGMLVVAAGFTLLAAACLVPPAAPLIAAAADLLAALFVKANLLLSHLPSASFSGLKIPASCVVLMYLLMSLIFVFAPRRDG